MIHNNGSIKPAFKIHISHIAANKLWADASFLGLDGGAGEIVSIKLNTYNSDVTLCQLNAESAYFATEIQDSRAFCTAKFLNQKIDFLRCNRLRDIPRNRSSCGSRRRDP